tara:strand:- start:18555 stop:19853 length:1299 start_codon:yes stop_codon:yes gene_type:complete
MEENYKHLQDLVDELKSTNATNEKIEVLKQYEDDEYVCGILESVYSPFKQFHVTSKTCKKNKTLVNESYLGSLEMLLYNLSNRVWTGHKAISYINGLVSNFPQYEELIYTIIDKNLKTRTGADLINKAIPGCVPTFKVALANSYDKQKGKVCFNTQSWFASHKLDGVRCLAVIDENGKCNFFSRTGKVFDTLDVLREEVESFGIIDTVLDGEVCLATEDGSDDFQGLMKEVKKKDHTIKNPRFKVFDMVSKVEFDTQKSDRVLHDRIQLASTMVEQSNVECVSVLTQHRVESEDHFQELVKIATKNNWEGLILRKDVGYKGKRSNDLLKVKKFFDDEYVVRSIETATHRIIVDGLEVEEEMLASVIIEHKGCEVGVGSGFDQDERRKYFKNPELIIGKTITVQYFEQTTNQDGCYSLRFPVVKHIYENGRNV